MDEGDWGMSAADLCVCSVSMHDTVPSTWCPFFPITSTPDGKHVVHVTYPGPTLVGMPSFPAITVDNETDKLSKCLFPVLHHNSPFRISAHISSTGVPLAYRVQSVKPDIDAAVQHGTAIVKEAELVAALCDLKHELYYARPHPPPPSVGGGSLVGLLEEEEDHPPMSVDDTPQPCDGWIRPLRPDQHRALVWMHELELRATSICLDSRVPISDTVAVDLRKQTLVCARTPQVSESVTLTMGVLTGDRGCGKTAVALALALSPGCPAPHSPLTPFEALHLIPCPQTTLLVVPRHLMPCWKMEIKACCPSAAVLFVSSARDARVITVDQVLSSRLVVTTEHHVASVTAAARAEEFNTTLRHYRHRTTHASSVLLLHAFKWGRIIVDEALRKNTLSLSNSKLHTNWWWCLCADANRMHPYKLLHKLEFATGVEASSVWAGSLKGRTQFCNTCVHVLKEPERPSDSWTDHVIWVELRPDEYMRYEAAKTENWSEDRLLKLCCGASPDQPGGFAPAQSLSAIVASAESTHHSTMRALKALDQTDLNVVDVTRKEVGIHAHFLKVVNELRQEHDDCSSLRVEGTPRQCPLCEDDACTILTACGHMYCWTCMFRTFHGAPTTPCPYCRRLLLSGDVYQLLSPRGLDQPSTGQKCVALVSMLSSLLVAQPQDSVAVYVAWSGMAQQLASVLENSGIAARGMGGNAKAVESAMRAFEAGEVRVLVLPYDHGEGLTLVCANHVVIYHATTQKHNQIALSSVNRTGQTKPIHMYRFIAKGTLEALMNHTQ